MPRKSAPAKAKAASARLADPLPNPLMAEPEFHPDLKPLAEALSMVCALSDGMARCYADMLRLKERRGLPKPGEWPDAPELQRAREHHDRMVEAARHDPALRDWETVGPFIEPEWTVLMREWSGYYTAWCTATARAVDAAKSPGVAAIMDAGEPRILHRWTTQTRNDLDSLAGALHPFRMGGVDGLGFVRCGLPPLPRDFRPLVEAVLGRIGELRTASPSAEGRAALGIGGTNTDWKDVQDRLLVKREQGEPYTSYRRLAADLECSEQTVRRAIQKSPILKGWQTRSAGPKTAPKATDLGAVVRDNTRQTTEPAPDDVLTDDDVDATMARLINQAGPADRAKLNALSPADRRKLVELTLAQERDDEPSPLKPDKPGERSRRVKQHKRA